MDWVQFNKELEAYALNHSAATFCDQMLNRFKDEGMRMSGNSAYNINRCSNVGDDMLEATVWIERVIEPFFEVTAQLEKGAVKVKRDDRHLLLEIADVLDEAKLDFEQQHEDREGYGIGTIVEMVNLLRRVGE